MKFIVFIFIFSFSAFSFEKYNGPTNFDGNYEYRFSSLEMESTLSSEKLPWASSFWPHQYGGIAFRWFDTYKEVPSFAPLYEREVALRSELEAAQESLTSSEHTARELSEINKLITDLSIKLRENNSKKAIDLKKYFFDIKRPASKSDVLSLSQAELDRLSPSEKFDIYSGNYNFRLTKEVLSSTKPTDDYWEGICHGWSSASLEFPEPKAISVTNADGIMINFASSDLKALLSYYHALMTKHFIAKKQYITGQVGRRCKVTIPKSAWFIKDGVEYFRAIEKGKLVTKKVSQDCMDMDAGAFHVILANQIALKNEGFVADIARDSEVWNQPIFGYKTTVLSKSKSKQKNVAEEIEVKTKMYYSEDGGRAFWKKNNESSFYAWWDALSDVNMLSGFEEYHYILFLDKDGLIVGGKWLSYERPDFIWMKKSKGFIGTSFKFGDVGYMNSLKNLIIERK